MPEMEESTKDKWKTFAWTLIIITVLLAIAILIINSVTLSIVLDGKYLDKTDAKNIAILQIVAGIFISIAVPLGTSILIGLENS